MEIKLEKIHDIFQFANKYVKIANKKFIFANKILLSPIKMKYRQ